MTPGGGLGATLGWVALRRTVDIATVPETDLAKRVALQRAEDSPYDAQRLASSSKPIAICVASLKAREVTFGSVRPHCRET